MNPIDTAFIILALGFLFKHPKQKYYISILPAVAFAVGYFNAHIPTSIEPYAMPVLAILVCISSKELAPMNLLLLFTSYDHFWEALLIPILWFIITSLMEYLKPRISGDYIPSFIRGGPIRIISLGILYHVFYSLSLL